MPLHVIHRHRRHLPGKGKTAAYGGTYQQCPYQTRSGRIGDALDIPGPIQACLRKHLIQQGNQFSHMISGGELRYHAAVLGVHGCLAVKLVGEQSGAAVVDGNAGFITGCLYSQDAHRPLRARPGSAADGKHGPSGFACPASPN